MNPLALTHEEIVGLTKRKKPKAQARVLRALGVPFHLHPVDGYPIVGRAAADRFLSGGGMQAANDEPAGYSVNLSALRQHGKKANARRS